MVKLNPFGVVLLLLLFLSLYLIYSSSNKTGVLLKNIENQHYERLRSLRDPISHPNLIAAQSEMGDQWPGMRRNSPIDDVLLKQELQLFQMINLKELLWAVVQVAQNGGQQVRQVQTEKAEAMHRKDKGLHDPLTEGDMKSHRVMVGQLKQAYPGIRVLSEENESKLDGLEQIKIEKLNKLNIPNELAWLPDRTVALTELLIWIDPLDATQEYTEGLLQYVTTMVCVAYKGKPIMGIIHKPFERSRSRQPSRSPQYETYWAWENVGHSNSIERLLRNRKVNRNSTRNNSSSSSLDLIVSRSHPGKVQNDIDSAFGEEYKVNVIHAGGSGYKTIELIKGTADIYMHNTIIKKWDICAPNAIINQLSSSRSAAFTDLNNKKISFQSDQVVHKTGVFATIDRNHEQLIKKYQDLHS